jgi:hypothetical protein
VGGGGGGGGEEKDKLRSEIVLWNVAETIYDSEHHPSNL